MVFCVGRYEGYPMRPSKNDLERLYFSEGLSTPAIARRLGVGNTTVKRWFKQYNIKTHPNGYWQRRQAKYNGVFRIIDTSEKAYWLGFIAGDGCIYESTDPNGKKAHTLSINLNAVDHEHLKELASFIGSNEKSVRRYTSPPRKNGRRSRMVVFRSRSHHLCKDLMRHGITMRKAHTITGTVIPRHNKLPFILGLFDADGTIVLHRRAQRTWDAHWGITGNQPLIEKVRSVLGINAAVITPSGRKSSEVYTGGRFAVEALMHKLYESCLVRLNRKYQKYLDLTTYNQKHRRHKTDEETYLYMRTLRESYYSINRIAEELNRLGVETAKGKNWTRSTVWRVLKTRMPRNKFHQIRNSKNWNEKTRPNIVKRIIRMRQMGMTYNSIAQTLNTEGITTYFGKRWRANTIHGIVQRENKNKMCGVDENSKYTPPI